MGRSQLSQATSSLEWLVEIMQRLLAPDGCPWDREQTLRTLRPYLLEECYELVDALDSGDRDHHREELGDVLFQLVFQAALAGLSMAEVITGIGEKLIRRHPHVFGDAEVSNTDDVLDNWERIKAEEKGSRNSALDGVPRSMPALRRSQKLIHRARRSGFRWPNPQQARAKVTEELQELDAATDADNASGQRHELGDLLLALVGWSEELGIDAEEALDQANRRFCDRFGGVEAALAEQGRAVPDCSADELLKLWQAVRGQANKDG